MKPIYTLGRQIYISLSIKRPRLRESKEVMVDAASTRGADASWRSAHRDKEASETKNMQTTALHASLTAHQTFIAWSHKRAVGTDDSWWLKSGDDREKGEEGTKRSGTGQETKGGEAATKELPTVYTYIMQMIPIISEVYNRSINLLTVRKGSRELRVTIRGEYRCLHQYHHISVLTHLLTAGYTPP